MKGSFVPEPGRSIAKTRTAVESRRSAASTTTAPSLGLPRHDRNDVDPVPARLSRALWVHAAVRALAPDQACWIVAVQSVVSGESTAASIGNSATPTVVRVWRPFSGPSTATMKSDAPFITAGRA